MKSPCEVFWEKLEVGEQATCPCCRRSGKIYKRKLNAGMASVLIRMYVVRRRLQTDWLRIEDIFGSKKQDRRDWTVMQHWGLIESLDKRTSTENASGTWKLTERGVEFVLGKESVQKHVYIWDDSVRGFSDEWITINDALESRFDYATLMAS